MSRPHLKFKWRKIELFTSAFWLGLRCEPETMCLFWVLIINISKVCLKKENEEVIHTPFYRGFSTKKLLTQQKFKTSILSSDRAHRLTLLCQMISILR